ncbi:Replication protein A 70 kDa DNA-binding subunit B, partial [Linum grandiflorum]
VLHLNSVAIPSFSIHVQFLYGLSSSKPNLCYFFFFMRLTATALPRTPCPRLRRSHLVGHPFRPPSPCYLPLSFLAGAPLHPLILTMLLRDLSPETPPDILHLRLLHAWKLGNPSKPDQFFAFGTLWTDAEGVMIQGDSHRNFADTIQKRISVGSVYKISGYSIRSPRATFRTTSFPHWLDLTPAAKFDLQDPTDPPFLEDAFDFVPLGSLQSRMPPTPYLTDIIGKVIKIGHPNHVERGQAVAPVQSVTIVDASDNQVIVSLWSDLSNVLDADALVLDTHSDPIIVAFCGLRIDTFLGSVTASTSLASRVVLHPQHAAADALRAHFANHTRAIEYVPPKFATPEKLKQHVVESYRTIQELFDCYEPTRASDPRYRCEATVVGIDQHQHWCYRACTRCSSAVVVQGFDYWCAKHEAVPTYETTFRYRLKLFVSDPTTQATFMLLGHTADRYMPITAAELAAAYPNAYGELPPPIQVLVGQRLTFEVHLPPRGFANAYSDFRISRIWGLHAPRAPLLALLPPPPPPNRSPSPPSRHTTPLPPDPAYVPPIPLFPVVSANPVAAAVPHNIAATQAADPSCLTPNPPKRFSHCASRCWSCAAAVAKCIVPCRFTRFHTSAGPAYNHSQCSCATHTAPEVISFLSLVNLLPVLYLLCVPTYMPSCIVSVIPPSGLLSTPPDFDDDAPLASVLRGKRFKPAVVDSSPPVPARLPLTPGQKMSKALATSPLSAVKQENLTHRTPTVPTKRGKPDANLAVELAPNTISSRGRQCVRKRLFDL